MAAPHAASRTLIDYETCVTCHDEGPLLIEIHDGSLDSGRIIVPTCAAHLRESFAYLLTVEAPRRGWTDGLRGRPDALREKPGRSCGGLAHAR
jgi:hypothetical protein